MTSRSLVKLRLPNVRLECFNCAGLETALCWMHLSFNVSDRFSLVKVAEIFSSVSAAAHPPVPFAKIASSSPAPDVLRAPNTLLLHKAMLSHRHHRSHMTSTDTQ